MAIVKVLLGAALASIAMLDAGAAAVAQQRPTEGRAPDSEMRSSATDSALLAGLLKRRAEVARSAGAAEDKSAALDFLDRRIAEVRSRIGN